MGKTYRKWMWGSMADESSVVADGSREMKFHRMYRKHEKDYNITSLQSDLIRTRQNGKDILSKAGFKTSIRMNHAKVGSAWRRPQRVFTLNNRPNRIKIVEFDLDF